MANRSKVSFLPRESSFLECCLWPWPLNPWPWKPIQFVVQLWEVSAQVLVQTPSVVQELSGSQDLYTAIAGWPWPLTEWPSQCHQCHVDLVIINCDYLYHPRGCGYIHRLAGSASDFVVCDVTQQAMKSDAEPVNRQLTCVRAVYRMRRSWQRQHWSKLKIIDSLSGDERHTPRVCTMSRMLVCRLIEERDYDWQPSCLRWSFPSTIL